MKLSESQNQKTRGRPKEKSLWWKSGPRHSWGSFVFFVSLFCGMLWFSFQISKKRTFGLDISKKRTQKKRKNMQYGRPHSTAFWKNNIWAKVVELDKCQYFAGCFFCESLIPNIPPKNTPLHQPLDRATKSSALEFGETHPRYIRCLLSTSICCFFRNTETYMCIYIYTFQV